MSAPPPQADRQEALVDADVHAHGFRQAREARRLELVEDYIELISDLIASGGEARQVDIAARLGPAFWRLRLGIGHPRTLQLNQLVIDFVLHRPSRDDLQAIVSEIDRALDCLPDAVAGDFDAATMKLHTRR